MKEFVKKYEYNREGESGVKEFEDKWTNEKEIRGVGGSAVPVKKTCHGDSSRDTTDKI